MRGDVTWRRGVEVFTMLVFGNMAFGGGILMLCRRVIPGSMCTYLIHVTSTFTFSPPSPSLSP
jgi:hypothetical protein